MEPCQHRKTTTNRQPILTLELALIISLIAHFVGDYLIQNQAMADHKTSRWSYALLHGFTYTIPFLLATHSIPALLIIALTHAVIDRYRLAKYFIWFKNQLTPKKYRYPWTPEMYSTGASRNDQTTGFPETVPKWMSVWLLIIVDNVIHIVINTLAIILFWGVLTF